MNAPTRRDLRHPPEPMRRAAVRKNRKAQIVSRRQRRTRGPHRINFTVGFLPGFALGFGTGIVYVFLLNWNMI